VPPNHGLVHCRPAALKAASLVEPTGQPAADGTVAAAAPSLGDSVTYRALVDTIPVLAIYQIEE
jgi:hypothetical protein